MDVEKLKYPIGNFIVPTNFTEENIQSWISEIAALPERLKAELSSVTEEQLNTNYRPEGWTVRQVVHHLADSHINAFTRCKLALTEYNPTIKPYEEADWGKTPDANMEVNPSLQILEGVHLRWVKLLRSLSSSDLEKTFFHPEHKKSFDLKTQLANYAWHCNHHLAHIRLVTRKA